jgi:RNA polymerase sigma-70 factor (ECF subfamily)
VPPRADSEFEASVVGHLDSAYNLASWLVRDPTLAEDVVQDAMERALKYFPGFRGENARGWVLQIVRNVAMTHLQAARRTSPPSMSPGEVDALDGIAGDPRHEPETAVLHEDHVGLAHALLERMPTELRECVVLRELEELSYKEIARVIDAPIGTVMSRLWRARKWLTEAATTEEQR